MKLSVIIPTYNRSQMVIDSIKSLLQQDMSHNDYEIIVVDNNSKDDTQESVLSYIKKNRCDNVRYFLEKRQGDFFARNTGAKKANGKYLIFSDDDALFDSNYLSKILSIFESDYEIGAVGTRIVIKWEGGEPSSWIKPYEYLLGADSHKESGIDVGYGMYINNGSLAIKRDLYIQVGGINPAQIGDYIVGDAEGGLCRKLHALHTKMAFTDDVIMWHRQIVGKNDTLKDIRRRTENNGITKAYTDVIVNHQWEHKAIILTIFHILSALLKGNKNRVRFHYLSLCKDMKYNEYLWRYQHDKHLKNLIEEHKKFDWNL